MSPYLRRNGSLLVSILMLSITLAGQGLTDFDARYQERYPVFSPDGKTLYYSLADHPRNQGSRNADDIWLMQRSEEGNWSRPLNAGAPINSFAADRIIGIGPNGQEIAVLRIGEVAYIDLLVKGHRSWRITENWPLEQELAKTGAPCFDLENRRLFYQAEGQNGDTDLFIRQALADSRWSEAEALFNLNTAAEESQPYLAPDGLSFYYRRDGIWQHSICTLNRPGQGLRPGRGFAIDAWNESSLKNISFSVLSPVQLVASVAEADGHQLQMVDCPTEFRPQECQLLSGQLQLPPAPSDQAVDPSLRVMIDGRERRLRPDKDGNYYLIVPSSAYAAITAEMPGYFAAGRSINPEIEGVGQGIASQTSFSPDYQAREAAVLRISSRIQESQEALNQLREERRQLEIQLREQQLAAGEDILAGYVDPELEALRYRYRAAQQDTVPPNNRDSPSARRNATENSGNGRTRGSTNSPNNRTATNSAAATERSSNNAEDSFDELERMKAIFRAQQEERMVQQGRYDFEWQTDSIVIPPPANARDFVARTIEEDWVPQLSEQISAEWNGNRPEIDSVDLQGDIRQGLFGDVQPAVYERSSWENELLLDIQPAAEARLREQLEAPIQQNLAARQRIDLAYEAEESEIARLRDSLTLLIRAQLAEEEVVLGTQDVPTPDLRVKGVVPASEQPNILANPAGPDLAFIPLEPGANTLLEQLQFAPNSAYFKPIAYPEMDRLVLLLQSREDIQLHFAVHTNSLLSYTAAQRLSEQRAAAIVNYFNERGVATERVSTEALGRSQPIADSSTPAGRSRNQRVRLSIR
ncbi:MAG: OmpA family protein [Bacteroidota bacterium]